MALTYTEANTLLRYMFINTGANVYVGLSTTTPLRDGTGVTEPPAAAGYARKKLTGMSDPALGVTTNTDTVYFAEATGDWGVCTYFCLFQGLTGDLLAYGALPTSIHPTDGKVPLIRPGNLSFSM